MWDAVRYIRDLDGFSVETINPEDNKSYWVDVWVYHDDVEADWNQYIFFLWDQEHLERKLVQESADNFEEATSVAICYLEREGVIKENEDGTWEEVR